MTIGYLASNNGGNFEHTDNAHLVYDSRFSDGGWLGCFKHTSTNWGFQVWDGGFPASVGDLGNWDRVEDQTSSTFTVATQSDARPTIAWDPTNLRLWMCQNDTSTEIVRAWTFSNSTKQFTEITLTGTPVPGGAADETKLPIVVDGSGRCWIIYKETPVAADGIATRYCDPADFTWKDGGTIDDSELTAGSHGFTIPWAWVDDDGDDGVCVGYVEETSANVEQYRFAFRKDSAAVGAAWTVENIDASPPTVDGHPTMCAGLFSGDTTSTVVFAEKTSNNNSCRSYRRDPSTGTWSSSVSFTQNTRAKMVMDVTNATVRVFDAAGDNRQVRYRESAADTTLSWSGFTDYLERPGTDTLNDNVGVPSTVCDSDSGWLVIGAGGGAWWDVETIASSGATVAVGAASETDTAGVVAPVPGTASVVVGAAGETDTAGAATPSLGAVSVVVGAASETDTAGMVSPSLASGPQSISVLAALETDTANAIIVAPGAFVVAVGAASETDTAGVVSPLIGAQSVSVLAALETDTAGVALPVGGGISIVVGAASETDTAGVASPALQGDVFQPGLEFSLGPSHIHWTSRE